MALMAMHGDIEPMPAGAIFADTGWEPAYVYEWLELLERMLPYPIIRVSAGNLRADNIDARVRGTGSVRYASLPLYSDGETDGQIRRQCTREYKIDPINRYLRREVLGLAKGQRAPTNPVLVQWRGISADEASRMKPAREKWVSVRYPLAMEHRMNRGDCIAWLQRHGYPSVQRSACIGCPFHSNGEWREMREQRPDEWRDAVEFDRAIRKAGGSRGATYLHPARKPLDEVLLSAEDSGQRDWINECEGFCGT